MEKQNVYTLCKFLFFMQISFWNATWCHFGNQKVAGVKLKYILDINLEYSCEPFSCVTYLKCCSDLFYTGSQYCIIITYHENYEIYLIHFKWLNISIYVQNCNIWPSNVTLFVHYTMFLVKFPRNIPKFNYISFVYKLS